MAKPIRAHWVTTLTHRGFALELCLVMAVPRPLACTFDTYSGFVKDIICSILSLVTRWLLGTHAVLFVQGAVTALHSAQCQNPPVFDQPVYDAELFHVNHRSPVVELRSSRYSPVPSYYLAHCERCRYGCRTRLCLQLSKQSLNMTLNTIIHHRHHHHLIISIT